MKIKCKNSYAEALLYGFIFYNIATGPLNPGYLLAMIKGFDSGLYEVVENDFNDYLNPWLVSDKDNIKVENVGDEYYITLPVV